MLFRSEHSINPNVISGLIPKKPLGKGDWSIDEVRRYASGIQYIFRQDAVPWLRPDSNPLTSKAAIDDQKFRVVKNGRTVPNSRFDTLKEAQEFAAKKGGDVVGGKFSRGVLLEIDGLTPEAEQRILKSLDAEFGSGGFTRLPGEDKVLIVNYRDDKTHVPFMEDEAFFAGIDRVTAANRDLITKGEKIWTEGEYGQTHDWKGDPAGSAALDRSAAGSPDLQAWLLDRREAFDQLLARYSGDQLADRQRELDLLSNSRVASRDTPTVADLIGDQTGKLFQQGIDLRGVHYSQQKIGRAHV